MRRRIIGQGILILFLAFSFIVYSTETADAAPSRPTLIETDWRTGEIQICWEGATLNSIMFLYVSKWDDPHTYVATDFFVVTEANGCYVSKYHENGQSLWYYVQLYDDVTGEWGPKSNTQKQTPPITAYIINWPDMFKDLINGMKEANDALADRIEGMLTPSDKAMSDLQDAINGLKDALGVGAATGSGGQVQTGLDGLQPGMRPPIGVDDGNGTWTGGNTGPNLPYPNENQPLPPEGGGGELIVPNPDSGTANEFTLRIPYGVDMKGELLYFQIFTEEQMEKMKWLNLIRNLAAALIYIMFGMWLVYRFSPQLKS